MLKLNTTWDVAYSKGEGVTQNKEEAVKWYNIAAQQGHAKAQYNLGNGVILKEKESHKTKKKLSNGTI